MVLTTCVAWLMAREAQAFYNPSTGRWLSRYPIEERGDLNLYGFVRNDGIGDVNARDNRKATHHWFGLYVVGNNDNTHTNVEVDPWFSAGGIISPIFSFAQAQYFYPVLW